MQVTKIAFMIERTGVVQIVTLDALCIGIFTHDKYICKIYFYLRKWSRKTIEHARKTFFKYNHLNATYKKIL